MGHIVIIYFQISPWHTQARSHFQRGILGAAQAPFDMAQNQDTVEMCILWALTGRTQIVEKIPIDCYIFFFPGHMGKDLPTPGLRYSTPCEMGHLSGHTHTHTCQIRCRCIHRHNLPPSMKCLEVFRQNSVFIRCGPTRNYKNSNNTTNNRPTKSCTRRYFSQPQAQSLQRTCEAKKQQHAEYGRLHCLQMSKAEWKGSLC